MILILIGVCGCGKTSIGQGLAEKMDLPFRDADEFHSNANKERMSKGIPLTDEDRIPWLLAIHQYINELDSQQKSGVLTCSGLKKFYREILVEGLPDDKSGLSSLSKGCLKRSSVLFILLHGDEETIRSRIESRQGHFMPASLLQSQLTTLEYPDDTENFLAVDIDNTVDAMVKQIMNSIKFKPHSSN